MQEKNKLVRLIVSIVSSLILITLGVLYIISCIGIWKTGNSPFTRESIGDQLTKLAIPSAITVLVLIAGYVSLTVLFNEEGAWGLIPAVANTVYIIFMDIKDPIKFKLLVTLSFVPWMFYHFILKSYVGAFFDVATIVTNSITLYAMVKESKAVTE